jgi:hypothetical protein
MKEIFVADCRVTGGTSLNNGTLENVASAVVLEANRMIDKKIPSARITAEHFICNIGIDYSENANGSEYCFNARAERRGIRIGMEITLYPFKTPDSTMAPPKFRWKILSDGISIISRSLLDECDQ